MDLDASRLDLDVDVEIKSPHHGPVTWLDIDSAEERYLLTGLTVITAATGLAQVVATGRRFAHVWKKFCDEVLTPALA